MHLHELPPETCTGLFPCPTMLGVAQEEEENKFDGQSPSQPEHALLCVAHRVYHTKHALFLHEYSTFVLFPRSAAIQLFHKIPSQTPARIYISTVTPG
ncbi:Uncharacterized protein HZ326_10813 [Fusarium oxysporum f. sp. albedinis]|nr:Uncharacterized protein HZ326_10813 [Fusarium oxysporum f. sp. albedinis]